MAEVIERTVDVGPVTLTISEAGAGGRPFLLVHGFTGARSDFTEWLPALADAGWHAVVADNRGHGESDKPTSEDDYDFHIFAADKLALADALGWDRFVLLGHSMGGMIAQTLVLDAPERVEALILMDTHHGQLAVPSELVEAGVAIARSGDMETLAQITAADSPLSTEAHRRVAAERPGYVEEGMDKTRAASPAMFARMFTRITEPHDRLESLAQITCPTLVIVGDQDLPFIDASHAMAATIPGAQLAVIPDAGHSPQFESPDAWWSALSGFLGALG